MYYSILDEMVNGPGRWFHSSYLDDYASRLATFGMASTSVAQPGGYIDQRASLLQSRIQAAVYPQVRLTITTNGGANFSTPSATVNLGGTAPVEVGQLLITTNSDAGTLYDPGYPGLTTWQLTDVPLIPGTANALVVYGLDLRGNIVDSDSITVTSTATWNPPAITGIDPAAAPAGADVDLRGTDFHNGLKVFFGGCPVAARILRRERARPGQHRRARAAGRRRCQRDRAKRRQPGVERDVLHVRRSASNFHPRGRQRRRGDRPGGRRSRPPSPIFRNRCRLRGRLRRGR
jgi:hypothetical protein